MVLVTFALANVALAESSSKDLQVTAQVIASAVITVDGQPASVEVTAADIERGYVDVAAPLQWRGKTNSRRGYLLQVTRFGESFRALSLAFDQTEMHVSDESWVARPYVPGGEALAVRARLILSHLAQPGRHALPILVTATPL